jgi:hypothetical protein
MPAIPTSSKNGTKMTVTMTMYMRATTVEVFRMLNRRIRNIGPLPGRDSVRREYAPGTDVPVPAAARGTCEGPGVAAGAFVLAGLVGD